jgi:hypothetical protein
MPFAELDGFQMIIPLPEAWFTEIGRVAVYWSHLEELADRLLYALLNHPGAAKAKSAFGYKGHLGIAFKRRMRLLRMVASEVVGVGGPQFEEFSNLIDKLSAYRGTRDTYIHGLWGIDRYDLDDVAIRRRSLGKEFDSHPSVPVTVEQLREFSRELSTLSLTIPRLGIKLGVWHTSR